jgi:sugar-specific transcriptional regulator TrmB
VRKFNIQSALKKKQRSNSITQEERKLEVLMNLGLTLLQAKTYLALVKFESADVQTIFKASKIARQDVYRVMPSLQKLGLAQEIIGKPMLYRPTPLKQGYSLLLENQSQKHIELEKQAKDVIKNLDDLEVQMVRERDPQFMINHSEQLLTKWFDELIHSTQETLDVMCGWRAVNLSFPFNTQDIKQMLKRNVKIRLITDKNADLSAIQRMLVSNEKNILFGVHFVDEVPVEMAISDRKQVGLSIALSSTNGGVPSLWSNHPQFVKVMVGYYESSWEKTLDTPFKIEPQI